MPPLLSVTRLAVTWLAMAVAMSGNGIARELGLKRLLRPDAADMVSALLGMALIGAITYVGFRPLSHARASLGQLALLSATLVVATVGFETVLGRIVDHKSWHELLQHYAIWRGELWPSSSPGSHPCRSCGRASRVDEADSAHNDECAV